MSGQRRDVRSDRTRCTGSSPSVVVYPTSTEDVVKIVKTAVKYKMPVIPYSAATSLEGHFRAVCIGSVSLFAQVDLYLLTVLCLAFYWGYLRRYVEDGQDLRVSW